MTVDLRARVAAYAACFEQMKPATVSRLREVAAAEVHFRDPFNDVRGIERMERCMHAMYADATEVRFKILHWAIEGETAYLRWRFWFKPKRLKADRPWEVEGMSELRFDAAGLVIEHIDHWDAASQFYARLPVLGSIIRWVQKRLRVQ